MTHSSMRFLQVPFVGVLLIGVLTASAQTNPAAGVSLLDGYTLVKGPIVPAGVEDNLSGLTYDAGRDALLAVLNKPTRIVELDREGKVLGTIELQDFEDTEDLASLGGGRFAIIEERRRVLSLCKIPAGAKAVSRPSDGMLVEAQAFENVGLEGVAFDAAADRFFVVKEKEPRRIYVVKAGAGGTAVTNPWDLEANNFGMSDVSAVTRDPVSGHLLLVSEESRCIVEITEDGKQVGRLSLAAGSAGLTADVPHPEGIAFDPQGRLYIVSEPNTFYVFGK